MAKIQFVQTCPEDGTNKDAKRNIEFKDLHQGKGKVNNRKWSCHRRLFDLVMPNFGSQCPLQAVVFIGKVINKKLDYIQYKLYLKHNFDIFNVILNK